MNNYFLIWRQKSDYAEMSFLYCYYAVRIVQAYNGDGEHVNPLREIICMKRSAIR
jgi:hypothetical protein